LAAIPASEHEIRIKRTKKEKFLKFYAIFDGQKLFQE